MVACNERGSAGPVVARRLRREDELLAAATEVFHEHGYVGGSLQMVADRVGIRKGSIYHYITTKEDLLYRLLMRLQSAADEILREVACRAELDPGGRLALYVQRLVECGVQQLDLVSIYCNEIDCLGEERRREVHARRSAHERFVLDLITAGQSEASAQRVVEPRVLSSCIFGAVMWTFRCHSRGATLSPELLAEACSGFVLAGLAGCGAVGAGISIHNRPLGRLCAQTGQPPSDRRTGLHGDERRSL